MMKKTFARRRSIAPGAAIILGVSLTTLLTAQAANTIDPTDNDVWSRDASDVYTLLTSLSDPEDLSPDALVIGRTGAGLITTDAGSSLAAEHLDLGYAVGSTGHLTLQGPGSMFVSANTIAGSNYLGRAGDGHLDVLAGAYAHFQSNVRIAHYASSTSSILVSGPNSRLDVDSGSAFILGARGAATLDILDGGIVSVASEVTCATDDPGSSAAISIDGADSHLDVMGNITLDGVGIASLSVTNGGVCTAADSLYANPDGTLHLDGGTIEAQDFIIPNGWSQFTETNGVIDVAHTFDCLCDLHFDGADQYVNGTPEPNLVFAGTVPTTVGALTLENGASRHATYLNLYGPALITGPTTYFECTGGSYPITMFPGSTLDVNDGATLMTSAGLYPRINQPTTISDPGTVMEVGHGGLAVNGSMLVRNGAVVHVRAGGAGVASTSTASLTLSGASTLLDVGYTVTVGDLDPTLKGSILFKNGAVCDARSFDIAGEGTARFRLGDDYLPANLGRAIIVNTEPADLRYMNKPITLSLDAGFVPQAGMLFHLLDAPIIYRPVNGSIPFDTTNAPLPAPLFWDTAAFADTGDVIISGCPVDFDHDADTDVFDFSFLLDNFGKVFYDPAADLNHDDEVDVLDFAIFAANFGCAP